MWNERNGRKNINVENISYEFAAKEVMLDTDDEIIIDNYAEKEILDDLNTINKKSNNYFIK